MIKKILVTLLYITLIHNVFANEDIKNKIDQLISQTNPNTNIGIRINNLETGQTVYERNANSYFIPASTMKFISLVSLLEYFGEDYKFTSKIFKHQNDYYISIYNPNFRDADLQLMLDKIIEDAGKVIKGNIFIINKEFSVPAVMGEKTVSDTNYCNSSLITKIHIDKNCSKVNVKPSKVGQRILVKSNKNFPYIVQNNSKTVDKNKLDRLNVRIDGTSYIIDGTLSSAHNLLTIGAVTIDNISHIIQQINRDLVLKGAKIKEKVSIAKLPQGAKEIYSSSVSYLEIAHRAMNVSDNFLTDYLLAEYATQGNFSEWRTAVVSMKHLASRKFGVDLKQSAIHDASGISRRNLLTINQLSDFLSAVHKSPHYEVIKSLMARPGDENTLRGRFQNVQELYVKTGGLANVSALIGYFKNSNGQQNSFVIIANNFYSSNALYHKLEEAIIRLFID